MAKVTATVYDTVDPYQWVTDIAHQAWKTRDREVWANNIQDLITPDAVILDAGCGLGRLLPRFWQAKKIVLVEPDRKRFLHASVVANCLLNSDEELLEKLKDDGFWQTQEYENLLQAAYTSPVKSDKVHLLNDVMQSPAIGQYGKFDLIVCSHIFEHISLDIIQESIAAFYNFLKPNGSLVIFACKSPTLYHVRLTKEFDHQNILITRSEFAEICQGGPNAGLGIRYLPFDLLQTILANPFNPSLQETFPEEFKSESAYYQLPNQPLFAIKQWEAYHSEFYTHKTMNVGTYIEYPQIQARLYRPIKPIESVAEILDIEHQVNQNETLKKMHLIDMVVVANKNE
ncbi:class I SAM-dependent methyltransferase [Calothrix sp. FACHB-1219]|uniref:class I SAM-dependent methyltransferase n=1 Tax=unclassified Calothrix TaxID=2619626 RepID=UPI0016837494|nr:MULTISPECIES: class I SAM-dependent methyltransferase [unclassified Calothrix]MBD2202769.1 class I SAM-dependent methyltransferase [Calothrix sp. FACHB-168]MBD2218922.1 class I SAM-dependent methyltransferase [Calothrix sp. FACHB-1219]